MFQVKFVFEEAKGQERSGVPAVAVWDVVRLCWACSFMLAITAAVFRARTVSALRSAELSENKETVHHPESQQVVAKSKCFRLCKREFVAAFRNVSNASMLRSVAE